MDDIFAAGRHLATYAGDTIFNHSDWLGTARARRFYANHVTQTCASNPFGDALSCLSGRTSPLHFTGKQRDSESDLDNFGARYDSSSLGRFMSSDPKHISAHLADPQSFNRYAYARNNPLVYVDPDGQDFQKAVQDLKTFAKSLYGRVSIGVGYDVKLKVGTTEVAKVGVAYRATAETSQEAILKVQRSFDAGASTAVGARSEKAFQLGKHL